MGWDNGTFDRTDDPYHAWAFLQAQRNEQPTDEFCPVIVSARLGAEKGDGSGDDGAQQGNEAFIDALDRIEETANAKDGFFRMSDSDLAHLSAVRIRRTELEEFEEVQAYERVFLVFVRESDLFPVAGRKTDEIFDQLLEILYIGRPIGFRNAKVNIAERDIAALSPNPTCLAIIDDSIAFLNSDFRASDGSSLFDAIWVQDVFRVNSGQVETGVTLTTDDINSRLAWLGRKSEREVYEEAFNVDGQTFRAIDTTSPRHQPLSFMLSHGTHVASAALSSFKENGGDLSSLSLLGVSIPVEVTQDTSGSALGAYILTALRQVMLWADNAKDGPAPLVINFSYGFNLGSKDGLDPLNQIIQLMIDSRVTAGRPTTLVVPMGNSYQDRGVAAFELAVDEEKVIDWVTMPEDRTPSFLEVLSVDGDTSGSFDLGLRAPQPGTGELNVSIDGSLIAAPDTHGAFFFFEAAGISAAVSEWSPVKSEPFLSNSEWRRRAVIACAPTMSFDGGPVMEAGRWKVRVTNTSEAPIKIIATVRRDDSPGTYPQRGRQSFLDASDSYGPNAEFEIKDELFPEGVTLSHRYTLSNFASNQSPNVLAVGAGMGVGTSDEGEVRRPSPYTSAGPRGGGKFRPDATRLADRSYEFRGIFRAGTYSGAEVALAGTSVAAPQLAGELAAQRGAALSEQPETEQSDLTSLRRR